ncbi:DUF2927 domain-containing protein [Paroceanicella profunda]|uniref:DUF2927 domain-containing protein n=1 Tax=Paroceanicella profunda TaxID=2579971 RepID=A0A5B8FW97_9RHOB|nr:DUF2927 domain-containing protein [Paroceanicella profunda]QDL90672.1 DUF2927 domain-containing protein [Paroceanicella profunda]
MTRRFIAALLSLALPGACVSGPPPGEGAAGRGNPARLQAPMPGCGPGAGRADCASGPALSTQERFRLWGARLVAQGRLRTDFAPPDAPVTAQALARDFERVALHVETARDAGGQAARDVPIRLSRWETPVRIRVVFDAGTPERQRRGDIADIRALAGVLARASGLALSVEQGRAPAPAGSGEIAVLVLGAAERHALAARTGGGMGAGFDAELRGDMPSPCFFRPESDAADRLTGATVIVAAEARGLVRLSCFHEEITQSLGLPDDGPDVRPSLFNDDQEFALITRHDVALLRMVYDRSLHPGMTAEAVRPLLPAIAARALAAEARSIR